MPYFHAVLSGTSNLIGDIYILEILPPASRGPVDYTLTAHIVEDMPNTLLSPELAQEFGVLSDGDEFSFVLSQLNTNTLNRHVFSPIRTEACFAPPRLGPNYILIGMDVLQQYFEIALHTPKPATFLPPFLFFKPHAQYANLCYELTRT